jgi:hypothetical protein
VEVPTSYLSRPREKSSSLHLGGDTVLAFVHGNLSRSSFKVLNPKATVAGIDASRTVTRNAPTGLLSPKPESIILWLGRRTRRNSACSRLRTVPYYKAVPTTCSSTPGYVWRWKGRNRHGLRRSQQKSSMSSTTAMMTLRTSRRKRQWNRKRRT